MASPFDSAHRKTDLENATRNIERAAYQLLEDALADLKSRGLGGIGFDPRIHSVFELFAEEIFKAAIEFDKRHAQYELAQLSGSRSWENPFSEINEQELVEFVKLKIRRLPNWIRGTRIGHKLWTSKNHQMDSDTCRHHFGRIERRIRSEYGKRRAEFDVNAKSLRSSSAGNRKPHGTASKRGKHRRGTKAPGRQPAALKILAGLSTHHEYDNGACDKSTPIVLNIAAKEWGVGAGTLSGFLRINFGGYDAYVGKCNRGEIAAVLKRLSFDYTDRRQKRLPDDS